MRTRLALVALTLALVAPGVASAAAPWSEPQRIPGSSLQTPSLAFGPTGSGLAWWLAGPGYGPSVPSTRAAAIAPDGAIGPARSLARRFAADAHLATDGGDRIVAVGSVPGPGGAYTDVAYASGRLGGSFGSPRRFLPRRVASVAADSNARGDIAVVGLVSNRSPDRSARRGIFASVRHAGGRFSRPQRLVGRGGPALLAVAVNERREVLVAWIRSGRVFARLRSASGRLGPVERLASDRRASYLLAALDSTGQAAVMWTSHPPAGESPYPGDTDIRLALRRARGSFDRAHLLDHLVTAEPGLDLAPVGDDRIAVAWNAQQGEQRVVREADAAGGELGSVRTLSDPATDALLLELEGGAAGEAVAEWVEPRGGEPGFEQQALRAATRPPGASDFSVPEEIAGPIRFFGGDLAIDPASGRVLAAWAEVAGSDAFSQIATRPPIGP